MRFIILGLVLAISPPALAATHWGAISANSCSTMEHRQYSAQLLGIPFGQSWEAACASASATISGIFFARPTRCVNKGLLGMWGEWDVPDSRCPYWGTIAAGHCSALNRRQYSAQLMDVPSRVTWEVACASKPATVAGLSFARPTRCVNKGIGMWGEWDVPDNACPRFGEVAAKECVGVGLRKFSAQILDVPSGMSWETACAGEPATINGTFFSTPTRCLNMGVGEWGEWDAPDTTCPHWASFTRGACIDFNADTTGKRDYSAQLMEIASGLPWKATCEATSATVEGQFFPQPTYCGQNLFGIWGHFAVADQACPHCGDGACDDWIFGAESCRNCAADCGPCPVCGNGKCEAAESPRNCSADCGTCGNGKCDAGETGTSCAQDCGCGNHVCDADESCSSCSVDCGACVTTCSGQPVGSSTQTYTMSAREPYSQCALFLSARANSVAEATGCVELLYPGREVEQVTDNVSYYPFHSIVGNSGCAQHDVPDVSPTSAATCAAYRGYPLSGPC